MDALPPPPVEQWIAGTQLQGLFVSWEQSDWPSLCLVSILDQAGVVVVRGGKGSLRPTRLLGLESKKMLSQVGALVMSPPAMACSHPPEFKTKSGHRTFHWKIVDTDK